MEKYMKELFEKLYKLAEVMTVLHCHFPASTGSFGAVCVIISFNTSVKMPALQFKASDTANPRPFFLIAQWLVL